MARISGWKRDKDLIEGKAREEHEAWSDVKGLGRTGGRRNFVKEF